MKWINFIQSLLLRRTDVVIRKYERYFFFRGIQNKSEDRKVAEFESRTLINFSFHHAFIQSPLQSVECGFEDSQARWSRVAIYHNLSPSFSVVLARRFRIVEEIMPFLLSRRNLRGSNRPRHLAHCTEIPVDSVTTGNTEKYIDILNFIVLKMKE